MNTRTLTISILLLAMVLAPAVLAADGEGLGPRGPQARRGLGGPQSGGNFQGRPDRSGGGMGAGAGMQQRGTGGIEQMLLGRLGDRLELTQDQKDQIKAIVEGNKEHIQKTGQAVREAVKSLHEATVDGTEAEIIAAGKAVGDTFTQQALQQANVTKQIKATLTAEQLGELEELKAEMKNRMEQRQSDGPAGGFGPGRGQRQGRGGQDRGQGQRGQRRQSPREF